MSETALLNPKTGSVSYSQGHIRYSCLCLLHETTFCSTDTKEKFFVYSIFVSVNGNKY